MAKRFFDIVFSLLAIAFASPLMFGAALAIALSSPGPILYRARRAGLGGIPFTMHKFRTMHHNRPSAGPVITSVNDPRTFAVGRMLRKFKIDELPQLFDVLRGEMSIVGPRPEDPAIVERYYTPEHRRTLNVKPGITSAGAIWGYRNEAAITSFGGAEEEYAAKVLGPKLAIEQAYLDSRPTLLSDLGIITRTLAQIVSNALSRDAPRAG